MKLKLHLVLIFLVFLFCTEDQGFVSPSDLQNLAPLATFQGKAANEGDTALGADRLLNLQNPRIALMWHFLSFQRYMGAVQGSAVLTSPPYHFSGSLLTPPPAIVYNGPEVALGTFVLYSDVNRNGQFDRMIHPQMSIAQIQIDSLSARFNSLRTQLISVSDTARGRTDWLDTLYIGYDYSICKMINGKADTLLAGNPLFSEFWEDLTNLHSQVLNDMNKWERFFSIRKHVNPWFRSYFITPGYRYSLVNHYRRKLFPQRGKEADFDSLYIKTVEALALLRYSSLMTLDRAEANKWLDYPFDGFNESGQDWAAGRSNWFYVLYFPDKGSLQQILDAEKASSFDIEGKERLHTGYNIMTCTNQYECRVLSWDDSILIDLGESEAYYNSPTPLKYPVTGITEPASAQPLAVVEGIYEYRPFMNAQVLVDDSLVWLSIPDFGIVKLVPAGSDLFFSTTEKIQIKAIVHSGRLEKLLLYMNGGRYVLLPLTEDRRELDILEAKIRGLCNGSNQSMQCPSGLFEYGNDTLKVTGGVSFIRADIPKMESQIFHAGSDNVFCSSENDIKLRFEFSETNQVNGLHFTRSGNTFFLPSFTFSSTNMFQKLGIDSTDSLHHFYEHTGSVEISNLQYTKLSDGKFVKGGDGAVCELYSSTQSDSVSLYSSGDRILFRIDDQQGRIIGLECDLQMSTDDDSSEVLFQIRGGIDSSNLEILRDWKKQMLYSSRISLFKADPFLVENNQYFLEIRVLGTKKKSVRFAIDGYTIGEY